MNLIYSGPGSVQANDMLPRVEAHDGVWAHGGYSDALEVSETLGLDEVAGEKQAADGLADLRLLGTAIVLLIRRAYDRSETDMAALWEEWWMGMFAQIDVEDEDCGCVDNVANDLVNELCWQGHGGGGDTKLIRKQKLYTRSKAKFDCIAACVMLNVYGR